jgi:hypothetical protein
MQLLGQDLDFALKAYHKFPEGLSDENELRAESAVYTCMGRSPMNVIADHSRAEGPTYPLPIVDTFRNKMSSFLLSFCSFFFCHSAAKRRNLRLGMPIHLRGCGPKHAAREPPSLRFKERGRPQIAHLWIVENLSRP